MVSATPATGAVEALLLEPVIAPLFAGCDAAATIEAGEFALQLAKQLQVRP